MPGGLFCSIGNPLSDGTWTYTWQNGRQLARMQSVDIDASFVYNESGLRVQKTVNGVVSDYTLHGRNVVHMTQGENELHFFYDASNKPSVVVFNGVPYSYVKNLQGDVVAILDVNGAVAVSYVYDAWGRPISKTGSLASTLGTVQPFRYRGYVYDEETGLYYLRSRSYSPCISRFLNSDSELLVSETGFIYNLYAYCSGDPITKVDLDGREEQKWYEEDDGNATNDLTGAPGGGPINYTNTVSNSGGSGRHPGRSGGAIPNERESCGTRAPRYWRYNGKWCICYVLGLRQEWPSNVLSSINQARRLSWADNPIS